MSETNCTVQNRPKNLIKGFLYGFYFPILISAWAVFCYIFDLQNIGLFVLIGIAGFLFVTMKDITPIIPILTCFVLLVRDYAPLSTLPYVVAYVFLFTCIIAHFIFFPLKGIYLGKLFFPLLLVSAALLLGGVVSPNLAIYTHGLVTALAVGPCVLLIYLLFINGVKPPENFDVKIYLSICIVIATVFGGFELLYIKIIYMFFSASLPYPITIFSFGWGNVNTLAAMILIAVPLCAYLMNKTKRYLSGLAVIVYLITTLYLTDSDACQGILAMALPFIILQIIIQSKCNVKRNVIIYVSIGIVLAAFCGIALINMYNISKIKDILLTKTYDTGRTIIYKKAIDLFKQNPILGVGLGFIDESNYSPSNGMFNFHSTVFHVMATMGTLGIIAYTIFYFVQFKILLNKNTDFNAFSFISVVLLESYGLIDICRFNVIPLVCYVTLITLIIELEKYKTGDLRLPLSYKYKCKYKPIAF